MGGARGDGIHEGVGRRHPTAFGAAAMVELGGFHQVDPLNYEARLHTSPPARDVDVA
jgi:hypothetical protein